MPAHLGLFLAASLGLALFPGPSILFVSGRALAAGRAEGTLSCLGTGLGGMVHVLAATLGLSALLLASSHLFALLKFAGALYLVWMGLGLISEAGSPPSPQALTPLGPGRALRQGVLVEALNPKTALFFLAFLPQFINEPAGHVARQFFALGLVTCLLNTLADLGAVQAAHGVRARLQGGGGLLRWVRRAFGALLVALGAELALTARP
ncbi:LysE family translocator [Acidocella sp.]|uniref:LysE family translocator n=1 Tax=Acidocella sp. TaxID=50710 RepID=UPI00261D2976|nr:LysE family translocator [Acidocella sp.]